MVCFYGRRMNFTPRSLNNSLNAESEDLLVPQIRQISMKHMAERFMSSTDYE